MKNKNLTEYLTLLIRTPDPDIWVDRVLYLAAKHECCVEDSHLSLLGTEWGGMMRISGNWNTLAKMENSLQSLKEDPAVWLEFKRTESLHLEGNYMPYLVQIVGVNKPSFANEVNYFLIEQAVQLIDVQIESFKSHYSDSRLISLLIRIHIPNNISISDLRERFMILCDEMNADGILEPEKPNK